jgi:hypothetical protein
LRGIGAVRRSRLRRNGVVTGTVTIEGELANSGTVTFHLANDGKMAIGRIHPDGSYSLRTGQGNLREEDGGTVVPGEYIVTVSITGPPVAGEQVIEGAPPIPGPSLVAAKYASQETSDLKRTVKEGSQVIILELERAELAPPTDDATETDEDSAETTESEQETAPAAAPAAESAPATNEPASEKSAEGDTQ